MADGGRPAGGGGGGAAVAVALAVCAAAGMAQGGRVVSAQSTRSGPVEQPQVVQVDNASSFDGVLRVSTSACQDIAADQVRWDVSDARGAAIASITSDVYPASRRQTAVIGRGLPEGSYTVTATCLSDSEPVGDFRTATYQVHPSFGAGATGSGTATSAYPLPRTGR